MHTSTSSKLLFPLVLLLIFATACDQAGSEEEEPSGRFEAVVSGSSEARLQGTAYSPVAGNTLMLLFSAESSDEFPTISLAEMRAPGQTGFGRKAAEYHVSPDAFSTEDSLTVRATYRFCEDTDCDRPDYDGTNGSLSVEAIEDGVVKGTFSFEAVPLPSDAQEGTKSIQVEGSFEAPLRNVEG